MRATWYEKTAAFLTGLCTLVNVHYIHYSNVKSAQVWFIFIRNCKTTTADTSVNIYNK